MIHPSAIIHPNAKLDPAVRVGPYAVIDEGVEIGPGCVLGPHVHVTGLTTIGAGNVFHTGCVIGDAPQDLKYDGAPTRLRIGDHNVFREHVTVNRSTRSCDETVIGSHNYLMGHSHVAHNCVIGSHVILANGALLGGHAAVQDRAFISGNCLVHQFTRVGTLSMMQGGAAISQDLPPFTMVHNYNQLCGLNVVGLRRAGIAAKDRLELKRLYHALFRGLAASRTVIADVRASFPSPLAQILLVFMEETKRGVCSDPGRARKAPGEDSLPED
jgi:UDP-N-acetylglucosamine acyltransferase